MKPSSAPPSSSSLPLRLLHGVLFGGFTAICLVAGWHELEHLARTQLQPFHAGPPPRPQLLLAVLASLLGMGVVLVQAVRGRSARLYWSGLILGGMGFAIWGTHEGPVVGRSADSANLKILLVARDLNAQKVNELQAQGSLSTDLASWQTALEQVSKGEPSPVRTRSLQPLPLRLQKVSSPDALPEDAPPGTLLLYVAEGGVAYELHPVGLSPTGTPWRLRGPGGEPVVFRSAYNPEAHSQGSTPGGP